MRRPFVLVAAFRPFGGRAKNESAEALLALRRRRAPHPGVRTVLLPVSWARAFPRLAPVLGAPGLRAALLFGEAAGRRSVTVERWGRNRAAPAADMDGALPRSPRLLPRGALRRRATWTPREAVRSLKRAGVPAKESRDAGAYLGNAVLCLALEATARRGDRVPVAFVHLPVPGAGAAKGLTRPRLARAMAAVVEEACRRFLPPTAPSPARRGRGPRRGRRRA